MMAVKATSYIQRKKALIALICIMGILAVSYGMLRDNNLVFIIGLLFMVAGYLLIRRKIKDSAGTTRG